MAFSLGGFSNERTIVRCRALVFLYTAGQWRPVKDEGVYSNVQLCQRTATVGTSGIYRLFGVLETSGHVTLDVPLQPSLQYSEDEPTWHIIRDSTFIYGLRISPDSDAGAFFTVVQNTIRSLQVFSAPGAMLPPPPPTEAWAKHTSLSPFRAGAPSPSPILTQGQATPWQLPVALPKQPQPFESQKEPLQPQGSRRVMQQHIEQLCSSLTEAIQNGDQVAAVEMSRKLSQQKAKVIIKQKSLTQLATDSSFDTVSLRVNVEDKECSGGAFTMKVVPTTTIQDLQRQVFERYDFPVQVQKWIVNQRIAKPSESLKDCGIKPPAATVFLYLVSGSSVKLKISDARKLPPRTDRPSPTAAASGRRPAPPPPSRAVTSDPGMVRTVSLPSLASVAEAGSQAPGGAPGASFMGIDALHALISSQGAEHGDVNSQMQLHTTPVMTEVSPREDRASVAVAASQEQLSLPLQTAEPEGWQCPTCTLINVPTRPGCELCSAARPDDYVVPDIVNVDAREHARIEEEMRQAELLREAEVERQREARRERDGNLAALLQTAQQNIVTNTDEFDCVICYTTVEPGDGVVLRECLHSFCKECLREHIRNATEPEVQCPYQDGEVACHENITGQEIAALLPPEDFNKFLDRSLTTAESQAADSFHCKTANCPGWCLYEDRVNQFLCPVCEAINCLTCKAIHHPEMDCRQYQDDLKRRATNDDAACETQRYLDGMIASGDAMNCPRCNVVLLKKDGCDWMRCSMCKLEICWATRGRRWGPKGTGDISDGCRCRVGGVRCHPNCRNCH